MSDLLILEHQLILQSLADSITYGIALNLYPGSYTGSRTGYIHAWEPHMDAMVTYDQTIDKYVISMWQDSLAQLDTAKAILAHECGHIIQDVDEGRTGTYFNRYIIGTPEGSYDEVDTWQRGRQFAIAWGVELTYMLLAVNWLDESLIEEDRATAENILRIYLAAGLINQSYNPPWAAPEIPF